MKSMILKLNEETNKLLKIKAIKKGKNLHDTIVEILEKEANK